MARNSYPASQAEDAFMSGVANILLTFGICIVTDFLVGWLGVNMNDGFIGAIAGALVGLTSDALQRKLYPCEDEMKEL